jgi:hypothetical protein
VLVAVAGLVAAVGLAAVILVATNAGGGSSGDGEFGELRVGALLDRQERDGVPSCFDDPATGDRPICVYHVGGEDDEGWVAYDAQVNGCAFERLEPDATELVDSCTGRSYPFSGDGLPQYEVTVEGDDRLVIDLGTE